MSSQGVRNRLTDRLAALKGDRRWYLQAGLLFLIAVVCWLPRGFGLERFVLTDEVPWLWRSANFYYSLAQRNPAATDLNRSPGVVTMWVNTGAFLLEFPEYRGYGQGWLEKYSRFEAFLSSKNVDPHDILVTGRKLMALLNVALLALAFPFARRLFGLLPAVVGLLLIAFDPYHIALTRLAHLDGPLGSFLFLSLLAFLTYLDSDWKENGQRRSRGAWLGLIVSGAAAGLAVLAKIPGFIMLPSVAVLWVAAVWLRPAEPEMRIRPGYWWRNLLRPALVWGGAFLLAIFICFPAMWVQPLQSGLKLTLSPFGFAAKATRIPVQSAALLSSEPEPVETDSDELQLNAVSPTRTPDYFTRYLQKYLWHATPPALFGLAAAAAAYIRRKNPFRDQPGRNSALGMLAFVIIYILFMTIPPKSSGKYILPIYPVLDLIAGAGWMALASWVGERLHPAALRRTLITAGLALVVLVQIAQAVPVYPYYLTYINPLVGFLAQTRQDLPGGSGEGLDLAADYLNHKPEARNLKVMSWYGIGPFSYFFVGHTVPLVATNPKQEAIVLSRLDGMDYLVVYSSQFKRGIPSALFAILDGLEPEQRIYLKNVEYARIYAVDTIPAERLRSLE